MAFVETYQLSKSFGSFTTLNKCSLKIEQIGLWVTRTKWCWEKHIDTSTDGIHDSQ